MNWFYCGVLVFYVVLVLGKSVLEIRRYRASYIASKKRPPLPVVVAFAFPFIFLFTFVLLPFKLGLKV